MDEILVKNWRPISLINVDAKIASEKSQRSVLKRSFLRLSTSVRMRLLKGGRFFDAIRTIEYLIQYPKQKGLSGILVAVDFEKAFDTLNFNYLIRILHDSISGSSFIQWIRVLYENASSCVLTTMAFQQDLSLKKRRKTKLPSLSSFCLLHIC